MMDHQPVLRLASCVREPLRRYIGRDCRRRSGGEADRPQGGQCCAARHILPPGFDTTNSRIVALRLGDLDCAVPAIVASVLRSIVYPVNAAPASWRPCLRRPIGNHNRTTMWRRFIGGYAAAGSAVNIDGLGVLW